MRFPNGTYEPEIVALMGDAFDAACRQAEGLALAPEQRAAMASSILASVERGERSLAVLTAWALNALDAARFPAPADPTPAREPTTEEPRLTR